MNYSLLFLRTISHLKIKQVFYRVLYRLVKPTYKALEAPVCEILELNTSPIPKYPSLKENMFSFLNLEHRYAGWNFRDNGMLWAYNQNYFDWINQDALTPEDACDWIDKFIIDIQDNTVGLDSYPSALRCINWIKFFCQYPQCATKPRLDSVYSQLRLLEKKKEYHLMGNHLLEDAFALYIGAAFFHDEQWLKNTMKLLYEQLYEQILPDGAHYEQSPMYHCILIDRLLDCINIKSSDILVKFAQKMLGHLESIEWMGGDFPKFNDSANGISPNPIEIFDYAKRLGIAWSKLPLKESGYRKLQDGLLEAFVDIGNITATYQPGHTHADTFNYELRISGIPIVVDTGVSTYNKTKRRQLERSTIAHNTVSVEEKNSSEVWGGFRVGRRCRTDISVDTHNVVDVVHNGFDKPCRRRFEIKKDEFCVEDWYEGEAVSYIHLAEATDEGRVKIENAIGVDVKPWQYSVEYNRFIEWKVIEIKFKNYLKYTIR